MSKGADIGSKRLISLAPDVWVRWLLGDIHIATIDVVSSDFQWVSRESDVLLRVREVDHTEFLVLSELQLRYQPDMPRRMRAYAALAEEHFKLPVYPVLVNILEPGPGISIPTSYRSEVRGLVAHQDYRVINLWEVDAGQTLAQRLVPLLPFVPLMKGGREAPVLQQALTLLRGDQSLSELETLLAFFARFVLDTQFIKDLMRWDMTILKETPWYKEIVNEGIQLGRQEGIQQGRLAIEQSLMVVLAHRFGVIPKDVRETLDRLSLSQLQAVFDDALKSNTWDEFRASLPQQPE